MGTTMFLLVITSILVAVVVHLKSKLKALQSLTSTWKKRRITQKKSRITTEPKAAKLHNGLLSLNGPSSKSNKQKPKKSKRPQSHAVLPWLKTYLEPIELDV